MPAECFVQVINRGDDGSLLRQIQTGRYASVDHDPTWPMTRPTKKYFSADPMISFLFTNSSPTGDGDKFELYAPTGNVSDGVAIRSMETGFYLEIDDEDYLHPVCEGSDGAVLFKFERRFGCFNLIINHVGKRKSKVQKICW